MGGFQGIETTLSNKIIQEVDKAWIKELKGPIINYMAAIPQMYANSEFNKKGFIN